MLGATSEMPCVSWSFLPRLWGQGHYAAGSGWSEALTAGAGPVRRSYAGEAFQGCDKARQSPLGTPSACARFPPTSAPPAAALFRPFSPVLLLRGRLSDKPRTPTNNTVLQSATEHGCSEALFATLTCLTWSQVSSHCLSFFLASSKSLRRRDRSPLLAADDRLLKTGEGLGEKLPLTKSQMLLAPPFKPGKATKPVRWSPS